MVPIDVGQDGTLELQIVAPSSYGAPAGQVWIDDIALYETVMPALVPVSRDEGFNDEAAAAAGPDGSVYAAWLSFRDGADSIQLGRYRLDDQKFLRQGQWQVAGGPGTYVLGLQTVSSADGVTLVYANEKDGNWDVVAVPCTKDGPGKSIRVSIDQAVRLPLIRLWLRQYAEQAARLFLTANLYALPHTSRLWDPGIAYLNPIHISDPCQSWIKLGPISGSDL